MKQTNYKELLMKPTRKASLERMHAVVDTILMYMFTLVQEHISVEKNQLLLKA
jgi:hypothetical protein